MFSKINNKIGYCYNRIVKKNWSSNAFSSKNFSYLERIGSNNLDIMEYIKRNYNLPSYSLKNVTKKYLDEKWSKLDVDYRVIRLISMLCRESNLAKNLDTFRLLYRTKIKPYTYFSIIKEVYEKFELCETLDDIKRVLIKPCSIIGKYCIVDSLLCHQLNIKLQINLACEEISNVSNISMEDVIVRGVMRRTLCLLYKTCEQRKIIFDKPLGKFDKQNTDLKGSISGALVLDPDVGYWNGVVTLDFASLYPNIIINYNLCATTLRFEPSKTTKEIVCANGNVYYFDQSIEGVLPQIMKQTLNKRIEVKSKMNNVDKNTFYYSLLDCRQLALKITANSGYGYTASPKNSRAIMPVAICTTSTGRELLFMVKDLLTQKGGRVIYGDTDSNLVIMPIEKPLETFNSKLCIERLIENDSDLFEQISPNSICLKQEDNNNILSERYGINVNTKKGDILNISEIIEKQIENKSIKIAKYITDEINKVHKTNFDLEFESIYEHYLLIKKKHYIGKSYNKNNKTKLTQKGVLPVKRLYSDIEKNIYNNTVDAFFSGNNILDVYAEQCINIYNTSNLNSYINTIKFESLNKYADKKLKNVYIDKNKNNFTTTKDVDSRFVFTRKPVQVAIVLRMLERNDIIPKNERIEYVYYENKFGEHDKSYKKGDICVDYEYFYRNSQNLYIKKIEYLKRLTNSINDIVDLCNVKPNKFYFYRLCVTLAKEFNIEIPNISQCIKLTETLHNIIENKCKCDDECECDCSSKMCSCCCDCDYDEINESGEKIKYKKKIISKQNQNAIFDDLNLDITVLDEENIKSLFPSGLSITKTKPIVFIEKIRRKALDYLKQNNINTITNLCASFNSYFIVEQIFKSPIRLYTRLYNYTEKYYNKQCYYTLLYPLKIHNCNNEPCILFNNCLCRLIGIECHNDNKCIKPVTEIAKKIKQKVNKLELDYYKKTPKEKYDKYYALHYTKKVVKSSLNELFFAKKRSTAKLSEAEKIINYIINKNSFVNQIKYMYED